jgi:hypothetical protein
MEEKVPQTDATNCRCAMNESEPTSQHRLAVAFHSSENNYRLFTRHFDGGIAPADTFAYVRRPDGTPLESNVVNAFINLQTTWN